MPRQHQQRPEQKKTPARVSAKQAPEPKAVERASATWPERTKTPALTDPGTGLLVDDATGRPSAPSTVPQTTREPALDRRWESERDTARADRLDAQTLRREADEDEVAGDRWNSLGDVRDRRAEEARVAASHEPDPESHEEALDAAVDLQVEASATHERAEPLYDSAERRDATARHLEARGIDREQVSRQMRSDVTQAEPAAKAPTTPTSRQAAVPRRASQARAARGTRASKKGIQRG